MGIIINECAPIIPDSIIDRVSALSTAQLCDGMKSQKLSRGGCASAQIKPVDKHMKLVGTAYTVRTSNGNNYPIHIALYNPQIKPGYIMVIAGESYEHRCYLGDLIVATAKAIGLSGIVLDGYSRDREGCEEIGFPVFSRGFNPNSPDKVEDGEINGVVCFGGITVFPGDLIVGDYDGVCVIPFEEIENVLAAAEKKDIYEQKRRKTIADYEECRLAGKMLPELAPAWVVEKQNAMKSE